MTEKSKTTILEKAIDGARRIIKPKLEPMTMEEEYRNADVPMPKTNIKFVDWLIAELDNSDKAELKSRIQLAALTIKHLETKLLSAEKENDRLTEELQLAEMTLNPSKNGPKK
jgi:isoleucyl-tRNA synthetase|tara:strand:+ start:1070 stop:1408 length:339 start_codon:yes stop_codon:yes gene_type:complete